VDVRTNDYRAWGWQHFNEQTLERIFPVQQKLDRRMNQLRWISLNLIDPHPDFLGGGFDENRISFILADIRRHGYQQNFHLMVRRMGERFQTMDGHHWIEAAKGEGATSIPVLLIEVNADE
jgi:ParB-like chromosome segregation protein Spo0J